MNYATGFTMIQKNLQSFQRVIKKELDTNPAAAAAKNAWPNHPVVTLVYGAKDTEHNQAVVLKQWLEHTQ